MINYIDKKTNYLTKNLIRYECINLMYFLKIDTCINMRFAKLINKKFKYCL